LQIGIVCLNNEMYENVIKINDNVNNVNYCIVFKII